ncbi:tyrosine-type recombinase/integrase [Sneathia sanguinegens]|uniref:tyrosine-type recombinase/integrase n=1 Tax=Sneathia sanguinegens TaxID=40543 RepID=UPI0035CF2AAA
MNFLRHSHVSFLIKQGIEITAISKRLGHKNSQITLSTYAHFYNDKKDKIIDLLNELE